LDGVLHKINQFTIVDISDFNSKLIVPIITTQACSINFYWSGPTSSFQVFAPPADKINVTPYQTIANGTTSFSVNLNTPGAWHIVVQHNIYFFIDMKNTTVRITTESSAPCSNACF
jgi:hypothetical protein